MTKSWIVFIVSATFLISALYLCPCKVVSVAERTKFLSQSHDHDCCERMKNCPMPKEKSKGLMSMLSVAHHQDGRVEGTHRLTEIKIDFVDVQLEPVIKIASVSLSDSHLQTHSPPELYLKHSSLLI